MIKNHDILNDLRNSSIPIHVRFELIETYAEAIQNSADILNFMFLIDHEDNSILRHEISAQLLRINIRQPSLMQPIKERVEDFLINVVVKDSSIVSRHEAIESLSSIGGSKSLEFLLNLRTKEVNKDILDTIDISLPAIRKRLMTTEKSYS